MFCLDSQFAFSLGNKIFSRTKTSIQRYLRSKWLMFMKLIFQMDSRLKSKKPLKSWMTQNDKLSNWWQNFIPRWKRKQESLKLLQIKWLMWWWNLQWDDCIQLQCKDLKELTSKISERKSEKEQSHKCIFRMLKSELSLLKFRLQLINTFVNEID